MSDALETLETLCFRLRELAAHAMFKIDADRLSRAADEIAKLQARVDALVEALRVADVEIMENVRAFEGVASDIRAAIVAACAGPQAMDKAMMIKTRITYLIKLGTRHSPKG